ncbi:MAG: 30S ribosomal protein S20 [Proteobacteria bacterium]|nr:30S ribosomal protein S20 [Alphaproteobacteria bacterium]NCC02620.1 30S ribosomal protein S20 [Pseudomonadota bacterium]
MANHKSAAKRARQSEKRNELNRSRRSAVRSVAKAAVKDITAGDVEVATSSVRKAESALASAVSKGVMHRRTAARKTSRMAKAVKKLALAKKA